MAAGNWTQWTNDIVDLLKFIQLESGDEFTLARVYAAEGLLKKIHPNNNHVKAKIRQQMQILQDYGYVEFIDGRGLYRVVKSLPDVD